MSGRSRASLWPFLDGAASHNGNAQRIVGRKLCRPCSWPNLQVAWSLSESPACRQGAIYLSQWSVAEDVVRGFAQVRDVALLGDPPDAIHVVAERGTTDYMAPMLKEVAQCVGTFLRMVASQP
jgi:hypothetical protein